MPAEEGLVAEAVDGVAQRSRVAGQHESGSVCVVAYDLLGGAFTNLGVTLVQGFREIGWNAELLVLHPPAEEGAARFAQVPFRLVGSRRSATSIPALTRYFRKENHDVVLPLSTIINVPVILAHLFARVRSSVVVTEHTSLSAATSRSGGGGVRMRLLPLLVRRLYPHAAGLIAVSRTALDDPLLAPVLTRLPATVIGNPYTWDAVARSHDGQPHPWLLDKAGCPTLLASGALIPGKGFSLLIRAMAQLRERGANARLIILGEGEERAALERLVSNLGLTGFVDLPGYDDNPYPSMRTADAFVLTSRIEGSSMVLLEATRLGLPIVATEAGGTSAEIIRDGHSGLIVPNDDVAALVDALEIVVRDPQRARSLGAEAYRLSKDRSPARVAQRYLNFFARLPIAQRRT